MMTPEDRELVAALCAARAGLRIDPDKAYLIESRLAPVARQGGFGSLSQFIETLRLRGDDGLVWATVEAMAPPDTGFFRHPIAFEVIVGEVLPDLVRAAAGAPVRIWSAACGTGQEVYSLAMRLAEEPALASTVDLYASDLSHRSLEKAQAGVYSQFEVQRGLPARRLVRHFEKRGEAFVISPEIRQMVRWRRVNLTDDLAGVGGFDLILCRNVLGALTGEARERVLGALIGALNPGGRVVLGPAESAQAWLDPVAAEAGVFAPRAAAVRSAA